MNGLIIFLGESFRLGTQGTRNIGNTESYSEQIAACDTHTSFIKHIIKKYNMTSISVFLSSYTTQFDNELLSKYSDYLHLCTFKTPILEDKKICKNVKSIVGISPTIV
jgi:hypothetical protein